MTQGKRTSTVIGVKLLRPLYGSFLYRWGLITNEEASETSSVLPSGADLETYSAPTIWFAPGRFSTSTGCPQISEKRGARARENASVAPPGDVGTTIFTARCGKDCAGARRGTAASAAATNVSRRTEIPDTGESVNLSQGPVSLRFLASLYQGLPDRPGAAAAVAYDHAADRQSESATRPRRRGALEPHLGGARPLSRSLRLCAPGPDRLARLRQPRVPAGGPFRHGARFLRAGQRYGI